MPCSRRKTTISSIFCASPHSSDANVKPAAQAMNSFLRPKRSAIQPIGAVMIADGDDVGRQHPVDLVERGREAALHVGQRHVGDRGVERLHDGGGHGADRHQRAPQPGGRPARGGHGCAFSASLARGEPNSEPSSAAERAMRVGVDIDRHAHAGAQVLVRSSDRTRCAPARAARPSPSFRWRSAAAGSRIARRCRAHRLDGAVEGVVRETCRRRSSPSARHADG